MWIDTVCYNQEGKVPAGLETENPTLHKRKQDNAAPLSHPCLLLSHFIFHVSAAAAAFRP